MLSIPMSLSVLLPSQLFAVWNDVSRIVVETTAGSLGILPHRLDCVAALTPGLLLYETASEGEAYCAVDEGVLVKTDRVVVVSTRRALRGTSLSTLRETVRREFLTLDEREQNVRAVIAKLETRLLKHMTSLRR